MSSFAYLNRQLGSTGGTSLAEWVRTNHAGGPVYIYSEASIRRRVGAYRAAFPSARIHYALKANHHSGVLKVLRDEGVSLDVVSWGEAAAGLRAGFEPSQIIFSGVGKTQVEIESAIQTGIHQINVESLPELDRVARLAARAGKKVTVALRINPDVNPKTHPYIATGFRENKFGIDTDALPELVHALREHGGAVQLVGLTFHIGSMLWDVDAWDASLSKMLQFRDALSAAGFATQRMDIGGGVGIHYAESDETAELEFLGAYGERVEQRVRGLEVDLQCEPGRFLVARSGVLLTQVQYVKQTAFKRFVIVDAGMNELIRPALYQAHHRILPLREPVGQNPSLCDVVGPICESADFLAKDCLLPDVSEGDWLAVMDTGAYGKVMASNYNLREPAPEFLIR